MGIYRVRHETQERQNKNQLQFAPTLINHQSQSTSSSPESTTETVQLDAPLKNIVSRNSYR